MKIAKLWFILACLIASRFLFIRTSTAIKLGPDDFRRVTAGVRKKCITETQTTLEDVENTEYGIFLEDVRLKCYFKCALEKFKLMDKDGEIKYNSLKKMIPDMYKEIANEMVDSCNNVGQKDNCEKAFHFMKCMYEVNPIAFIAP